MKIWELCNKIMETNEPREVIYDWSVMNRICPISFDIELHTTGKNRKILANAANGCCLFRRCGMDCLNKFLDTEVT